MTTRIRVVETIEECEKVHRVAAAVWGQGSACSVPQLYIHATKGGVVLLAENEDSEPVGFLFSFPARYQAEWVLWSHETAVLDRYLHQGIGTQLKRVQREMAREIGYDTIAWTFDPLVSRNAYFNLVKLGAAISEYQQNVYGVDMGDLINRGLETDRFIAIWSTSVERDRTQKENPVDNKTYPVHSFDALSIGTNGDPELQLRLIRTSQCAVRTCIPSHFESLLEGRFNQARAWREAFRSAATELFNQGFHPTGFRFEVDTSVAYYIWTEVET